MDNEIVQVIGLVAVMVLYLQIGLQVARASWRVWYEDELLGVEAIILFPWSFGRDQLGERAIISLFGNQKSYTACIALCWPVKFIWNAWVLIFMVVVGTINHLLFKTKLFEMPPVAYLEQRTSPSTSSVVSPPTTPGKPPKLPKPGKKPKVVMKDPAVLELEAALNEKIRQRRLITDEIGDLTRQLHQLKGFGSRPIVDLEEN